MLLLFFTAIIMLQLKWTMSFQSFRAWNRLSIQSQNRFFMSTEESMPKNIRFDKILNARDLGGVSSENKVLKGRVIRTGCVSKATDSDVDILLKDLGIRTLIDLRSERELHEDANLNAKVYTGFESITVENSNLSPAELSNTEKKSRRFFISITNESLIKKTIFFRLKKRWRFASVLLFALSRFSRRADKAVRKIFLDKLNGGGLSLLNEIVLEGSGKNLVTALKIIAEPSNQPVALYCTAGKDRTGLISLLVLNVLEVSDEDIIQDYVLSDSVYKKLDDKAMVASLKQIDIDPNIFLRAKREFMEDTIAYLRREYGSIENYLDQNGFTEEWRARLRKSLSAPEPWKRGVV